jgi:hypothetical protein
MDIQPPQPQPETDLIPPSDSYTYKDQVCEIVETLTLDIDPRKNRTKQSILKNRFLSEVLLYETRRDNTKKYYNVFRFLVTTGSILLPAIMSVGQMDPAKLPANFDNISYWTAFMISLTVTISNGFLQLFSLDKNYFEFSLTAEQLKTEGWQFFQLAGKYEDYKSHEDAYKAFSKTVETIKRKQVEKEFQGKGDVNKNKKDKDKDDKDKDKDKDDKDKDDKKVKDDLRDEKMDALLRFMGQGQQPGLRDAVGGVRDILRQPLQSGMQPGAQEATGSNTDVEQGELPKNEKEQANEELRNLIQG